MHEKLKGVVCTLTFSIMAQVNSEFKPRVHVMYSSSAVSHILYMHRRREQVKTFQYKLERICVS